MLGLEEEPYLSEWPADSGRSRINYYRRQCLKYVHMFGNLPLDKDHFWGDKMIINTGGSIATNYY